MKKLIRGLGLLVEKINACKNDYMLYWKDNINMDYCKFCREARYKLTRERNPNRKKTLYVILRGLFENFREGTFLRELSGGHGGGVKLGDARTGIHAANLWIQLFESSNMAMISSSLNGNNWLTWSQSVKIELEGKDKVEFIDGLEIKPAEGSAKYKQWRITDSVNWKLDMVNATDHCCTKSSNRSARYLKTLVLDPLPNVSKAYSMVLRVERQGQEIQIVYVAAESQPMTETVSGKGTDLVSDLMEALKILQNKGPQDPVQVYFAKLDEMADEDIYMVPPEGSSIPAGKVCKPGTSITQHKFIRDIIQDTGLTSAKSASTPLPTGLKLSTYASLELSDPEPYRRLVGRLLYLSFT
ncbi:UNVERIFIED_CONTAM: hypothetical protein Scaly_0254200 [Sesamum calycinum]|uniref:Retrotransposon Copia-like N-terminal domain-containing protein n=1 Tax=Sesamum calycinum TaxID=2727403 RepID=A0AAW2S901_9LAMI